MAVSKRLRYEILRRDNHACRYCGATAPEVKLTVDHVLPTALGGDNDPTNLVTACAGCNSGKTSSSPDAALVADVSQDAIRWARAREIAARQMMIDGMDLSITADQCLDYWKDAWKSYLGWVPETPADAVYSMETWLSRGLPSRDLCHLADKVVARYRSTRTLSSYKVWVYYAGCCWTRLRELDDTTAKLIEAGEV